MTAPNVVSLAARQAAHFAARDAAKAAHPAGKHRPLTPPTDSDTPLSAAALLAAAQVCRDRASLYRRHADAAHGESDLTHPTLADRSHDVAHALERVVDLYFAHARELTDLAAEAAR